LYFLGIQSIIKESKRAYAVDGRLKAGRLLSTPSLAKNDTNSIQLVIPQGHYSQKSLYSTHFIN
jgi:hypothetical protein